MKKMLGVLTEVCLKNVGICMVDHGSFVLESKIRQVKNIVRKYNAVMFNSRVFNRGFRGRAPRRKGCVENAPFARLRPGGRHSPTKRISIFEIW
jgi:hypothetical protein